MRTIAISGSASGIGAATRAMLEAAGDTVIGIDLRDAEVTADLSTDGGRANAVEAVLDHGRRAPQARRVVDRQLRALTAAAG